MKAKLLLTPIPLPSAPTVNTTFPLHLLSALSMGTSQKTSLTSSWGGEEENKIMLKEINPAAS